ncbi:P pilus assembly chaperone PapD [Variovorax sp. 54]|uniref:fimbria/pilus chaperone family protein n=1 Tax=Variovorax sp. 54 TaxID=2035212 RepID=UPI000C178E8C|nr:fimbria/pilus chaperone family protein [Variovorax sp. 54]PIF78760.1 P pilus assembly chaperone PapD [Variovorax sp. 54]
MNFIPATFVFALSASTALIVALAPLPLHAAGMLPETSVVIVNESDGEASINVKNTDAKPALMFTSLTGIPGDDETLLIVTPPVARVEPGETQLVRFLLQTHQPLRTQRLRRVIFEGIPPKNKEPGIRVNMNVRQNLPVLIHPKGLAQDDQPWKRLKWSAGADTLRVRNDSPYVVRMAASVQLLPSTATVELPRPYVLPGETVDVALPVAARGTTRAGWRLRPDRCLATSTW